jgi:hypothetical protein
MLILGRVNKDRAKAKCHKHQNCSTCQHDTACSKQAKKQAEISANNALARQILGLS